MYSFHGDGVKVRSNSDRNHKKHFRDRCKERFLILKVSVTTECLVPGRPDSEVKVNSKNTKKGQKLTYILSRKFG